MFIAINAKSDVAGSKKGKLTPAQNAQLNAVMLSRKTGILDVLDRCEATDTSYNVQSGNIATISFKSGYLVICGRLVEVESESQIQLKNLTNDDVGKIVARFDLGGNGEEEFRVEQKRGNLTQNDLNANPVSGIYEFELYSYTVVNGKVILDGSNRVFVKNIDITGPDGSVKIWLTNTSMDVYEEIKKLDLGFYTIYVAPNVKNLPSKDAAARMMVHITNKNEYGIVAWVILVEHGGQVYSNYIYADTWTGWQKYVNASTFETEIDGIKGRLDEMGFKSGNVSLTYAHGMVTPLLSVSHFSDKVQLAKQGKCVIGHISVTGTSNNNRSTVCVLPDGFRPKMSISYKGAVASGAGQQGSAPATVNIDTNGNVVLNSTYSIITAFEIVFGFETA